MIASPTAARVSATLKPIGSASLNVSVAVRSSVHAIGAGCDSQRSTDALSTANGKVSTTATGLPVGTSAKPVPSTYGIPFTVMRTTDPGSLPLGEAGADAVADGTPLAGGVPDAVGDGDAPASVGPQA